MSPLVSIIIPVFNGERLVEAAIRSGLAQTERRIEIIVVDDGSTDGTAAVIHRLAAADGRVRPICLPVNRGPAVARNAGLDRAAGAWVATLDADDLYLPERLATLLGLAARHGADMVSDNLLVQPAAAPPYPLIPPGVLDGPRPLGMVEFVLGNSGETRQRASSYGFLQPMIRHAFLLRHGIRYDIRNRFGEDYLLYMHCLQAGACWWVTPEPFYVYTQNPHSLTQRQTASDLRRIEAFDDQLLADPATAADRPLAQAIRRHRVKTRRLQRYRAVTDAVKQGRLLGAVRLLGQDAQTPVLVTIEALRQVPTIVRKALRGGYRSQPRPMR